MRFFSHVCIEGDMAGGATRAVLVRVMPGVCVCVWGGWNSSRGLGLLHLLLAQVSAAVNDHESAREISASFTSIYGWSSVRFRAVEAHLALVMVGLALRPRLESGFLLLRKKLKIGDELLARCCSRCCPSCCLVLSLAAPSPRKL